MLVARCSGLVLFSGKQQAASKENMRISGFTIARNAIKLNYPILASIKSILPLVDEFIINVGDSEDNTLELIRSIRSDKIRIIQNVWDFSQGKEVLSQQTNLALKECTGDWAFYLQSDEVVHEEDLPRLKKSMEKYLNNPEVDALRFKWLHFYGSYFRYRVDAGWYQKQDRIIRNNGKIVSEGDAWGFCRTDGQPMNRIVTNCFIYHYGWVQPQDIMGERITNASNIGFAADVDKGHQGQYDYGDLTRFPPYFGSHPDVMRERVAKHKLSHDDLKSIREEYKYHPALLFNWRWKTGKRIKKRIT